MTCKDCIHNEICIYPCGYKDFKPRDRFVELPCKVGDTVYYFDSAGIVYSQKVTGFVVNSVGVLVDSDVMFVSNLIGKRFFLTHEEAEAAMKERETK